MNPLLKKLGYKDQDPVLILHAPDGYSEVISEIPGKVHTKISSEYDFIQLFVSDMVTARKIAPEAAKALRGDGRLWLCYPKTASKKYSSDITRDRVWDVLGQQGFEPVTQVSIDEDWSALRFRHVDNIKNMTRKFAATLKGKERIGKEKR
jgi:hypothetical protein